MNLEIFSLFSPLATLGYNFITEPDEDSLNQTFIKVGVFCGIFIGFIILFTIFMFSGGADLLDL